jgi:hypothetical protein
MKPHKKSKKTKIPKKSTKITIQINWNSNDCGYSNLKTRRVFNFLIKSLYSNQNLIQTQHNKPFNVHLNEPTKLYLQSIKLKKWAKTPKWNSNSNNNGKEIHLKCTEILDWLKGSPCEFGKKRAKLFVKYKSNIYIAGFGTYLMRLFTGDIDEKTHIKFVKHIKKIFRNKPIIIHNEDVDWFHMKQLI